MSKKDLIVRSSRARHYATLCLSEVNKEVPIDVDYKKIKRELEIAKSYIELTIIRLEEIIEQQNKIES